MPKTDEYEPELVVPEDGGQPFYLSDDGTGVMICWWQCHGSSGGCGQSIMKCNCKGGPVEPYYITRWRVEAQGGVWTPRKSSNGPSIGARPTSVRKALGKDTASKAPLSMGDFIDADVIAKVKAAKESQGDQDQ